MCDIKNGDVIWQSNIVTPYLESVFFFLLYWQHRREVLSAFLSETLASWNYLTTGRYVLLFPRAEGPL